jgi:ankyrin repeat protein
LVARSCVFGQVAYPDNIAAVVRELLQRGIFDRENINAPEPTKYEEHRGVDSGTQSLLDIAVAQQDEVLVRELLEFGADADGVDVFENWDDGFCEKRKIFGRSFPLRTAIRLGHVGIVKLLIEFGADPCCGLKKDKALDEAPSVVDGDECEMWKVVKDAIRRKK